MRQGLPHRTAAVSYTHLCFAAALLPLQEGIPLLERQVDIVALERIQVDVSMIPVSYTHLDGPGITIYGCNTYKSNKNRTEKVKLHLILYYLID